jgi:hypothetical protein
VAWMRVGSGAPIEHQETDAADDGDCDELDPERAVGLARDRQAQAAPERLERNRR